MGDQCVCAGAWVRWCERWCVCLNVCVLSTHFIVCVFVCVCTHVLYVCIYLYFRYLHLSLSLARARSLSLSLSLSRSLSLSLSQALSTPLPPNGQMLIGERKALAGLSPSLALPPSASHSLSPIFSLPPSPFLSFSFTPLPRPFPFSLVALPSPLPFPTLSVPRLTSPHCLHLFYVFLPVQILIRPLISIMMQGLKFAKTQRTLQ